MDDLRHRHSKRRPRSSSRPPTKHWAPRPRAPRVPRSASSCSKDSIAFSSAQSFMTLWSGRFDTEPDPAAFDFGISFGFDRALFEDDVTGSLAWAEALAAAGVLSTEDAAAIIDGARSHSRGGSARSGVRRPVRTKTCTASSSGSWSSASAMRAGGCTPAARATSRSRSTCGSISRRRIPSAAAGVVSRLVAACADQAEQAGAALMPSYTHLRRAQPVLVAHFFLAHAVGAAARLRQA